MASAMPSLSMRSSRVAVALWSIALVLTWGLLIASSRDEPSATCPGVTLAEGSSLETRPTLWPPGAIRCTYTAPDGRVMRWTRFPLLEWSAVVLFGLGVGLVARVVLRRGPPLAQACAAAVLLLGSVSVWVVLA